MDIYNYHSVTGEYISAGKADPDPVQKNNWLVPAYATTEQPPQTSESQVAVMSSNGWELKADCRGAAWKTDTGERIKITELGPLLEGVTDQEPGPFDNWVDDNWVKDTAAELEDVKDGAVVSIRQYASAVRQKIAGDADHYETAGWADKARRAERVAAGNALPGDADILQAEADRRAKGETVIMLAELQLQKAGKFALAVSVIDGLVSSAKTAIELVDTVGEIPLLLSDLKQNAEVELAALLNQ